MTINKKAPSFELSPEGLGSIIVYAIFTAGFLCFLIYFALFYKNMILYISIPFILLLGFWLILYIPYRLYLSLKRPIDTIVFSYSGIVIENKKIDLIKSIPWNKITATEDIWERISAIFDYYDLPKTQNKSSIE